jgi:hypothetical protein
MIARSTTVALTVVCSSVVTPGAAQDAIRDSVVHITNSQRQPNLQQLQLPGALK